MNDEKLFIGVIGIGILASVAIVGIFANLQTQKRVKAGIKFTFIEKSAVVVGIVLLPFIVLDAFGELIALMHAEFDPRRITVKALWGVVFAIVLGIWLVRAILRRLKDPAAISGHAVGDAIRIARTSELEKKLDELDRLHAAGKITDEERATARSAALTNNS